MKKKRRITAKEFVEDVDLDTSEQTARNRLIEKGYRSYQAVMKPFISEVNRIKRLEWQRNMLHGV